MNINKLKQIRDKLEIYNESREAKGVRNEEDVACILQKIIDALLEP